MRKNLIFTVSTIGEKTITLVRELMMIITELQNKIVLPFVTFNHIRKPNVVDSLDEMYDFVIPFVNEKDGRPFHLYFQADVNIEKLTEQPHANTMEMAIKAINDFIKQYVEQRNNEVRVGGLNTSMEFDIRFILETILFKTPSRKTIMGAYPSSQGKSLPTINLKLPRGATMFISAVCKYPDDSIKTNAIGTVNIFGHECLFFFKKNTCNINRHISHSTMQKEFEKAMYEAFSYLENVGSDNLPWNSKLMFLSK